MTMASQQVLEISSQTSACKFLSIPCTQSTTFFQEIPVIDFTNPDAKDHIVKACKEFGFFKLMNHEVPLEFITRLEREAFEFFNLPLEEKEKVSKANPFGYGRNRIGRNGDVGWIEFLLFGINPNLDHHKPVFIPGYSDILSSSINDYTSAVREMACKVLEIMADGLKLEPRNGLSRLINDEKSDTLFRLNHYPPCNEFDQELMSNNGRNLIGFGAHTDPQVISVIRSNNATGLQICLKDGISWVSIPPDPHSMFFLVGDSLQVMTNGRFKSVKHRVVADGKKSRFSMIFFGGPPLNEKISPLTLLMDEGEESLYKELIWCEFKKYANNTRVSQDRLHSFLK